MSSVSFKLQLTWVSALGAADSPTLLISFSAQRQCVSNGLSPQFGAEGRPGSH